MKYMTRLNKIERRRRQMCQTREAEIWIYTDGGADSGHDDTMARNARTNEVRPVAELPADCTKIVISYDRE